VVFNDFDSIFLELFGTVQGKWGHARQSNTTSNHPSLCVMHGRDHDRWFPQLLFALQKI
jgi:hypothetical protein